MYAKNVTIADLECALSSTQGVFDQNIVFKHVSAKTKNTMMFTLTVRSSKNAGSRKSAEGRRISAACWHAHDTFFDNLLKIRPDAVITTGHDPATGRKIKITVDGGNWQDRNIGSQAVPMMYSAACDCKEDGRF